MGLDLFFDKKKTYPLRSFRKVNFLVSFFESLGYYVENCKSIEVEKEDIIELIDRCNKVLADNTLSSELLPTCSGFFFGNTSYDEDYFNDVEEVLYSMENYILPEFDNLSDNEFITFSIWF